MIINEYKWYQIALHEMTIWWSWPEDSHKVLCNDMEDIESRPSSTKLSPGMWSHLVVWFRSNNLDTSLTTKTQIGCLKSKKKYIPNCVEGFSCEIVQSKLLTKKNTNSSFPVAFFNKIWANPPQKAGSPSNQVAQHGLFAQDLAHRCLDQFHTTPHGGCRGGHGSWAT